MKRSELKNIIKEELAKINEAEYTNDELRWLSYTFNTIEKSLSDLMGDKTVAKDIKLKSLVRKVFMGDWTKLVDYYQRAYDG